MAPVATLGSDKNGPMNPLVVFQHTEALTAKRMADDGEGGAGVPVGSPVQNGGGVQECPIPHPGAEPMACPSSTRIPYPSVVICDYLASLARQVIRKLPIELAAHAGRRVDDDQVAADVAVDRSS